MLPWRKPLTFCMAILIVTAYTHCVMTHAEEVRQLAVAHLNQQSPLEIPLSCGNESSCICKGAVLCDIKLDLPSDSLAQLLALEAATPADLDQTDLPPVAIRAPDPPPEFGGDAMRAQLQVFLL